MNDGYLQLGDETSDRPSRTPSVDVEPVTNNNGDELDEKKANSKRNSKRNSRKSSRKNSKRNSLLAPENLSADAIKNSVDMLVEKQDKKERSKLNGKYFGRCFIAMDAQHLKQPSTLDAIWEHNVQRIVSVTNKSNAEHTKNMEIWGKMKNVPVQHISLEMKHGGSSSKGKSGMMCVALPPQETVKVTEPLAQALMDIIEHITKCNEKLSKNEDKCFQFAGIQHEAQQSVMRMINNDFVVKSEEQLEYGKWVKSERSRLQFYLKHPQKKRGKVLLVYDNPSTAAFLILGYRMIVYQDTLQRAYSLFRHHFRIVPEIIRPHVYVLQSLDYARLKYVSLTMDLLSYHVIKKSLADSGFLV